MQYTFVTNNCKILVNWFVNAFLMSLQVMDIDVLLDHCFVEFIVIFSFKNKENNLYIYLNILYKYLYLYLYDFLLFEIKEQYYI